MTDNQFGVLITALLGLAGSIGATVRWAVNRFVRTVDNNQAVMVTALTNNTQAMIQHTASNTRLEVKIEAIADWAESHPTPPLGVPVVDPHGPARPMHRPTPAAPMSRTPVRGVPLPPLPRGKTRNEDR